LIVGQHVVGKIVGRKPIATSSKFVLVNVIAQLGHEPTRFLHDDQQQLGRKERLEGSRSLDTLVFLARTCDSAGALLELEPVNNLP